MKQHAQKDRPPRLLPDDLVELRLRVTALRNAAHLHMLVQEAYQSWVQRTLERYGLSGKYNVNPDTGDLVKADG